MAFARKAAVAALAACAASLSVHSDQTPKPNTARMPKQWSETRLGPAMTEAEACASDGNFSTQSEWKEMDPIGFSEAGLGARRLMYNTIDGMPYQLFLPVAWHDSALRPFPVHLDLHSHGERKWSLKNSQGFARMLARNQSQSFDDRDCWCLDTTQNYSEAYTEEPVTAPYFNASIISSVSGCPMADCSFADEFPGVVVMPQCWTGTGTPGWTASCLEKAKKITAYVIEHFNGNANQVIVSGTAEGGEGALNFTKTYPTLVSAVIVTDSPTATAEDVPGTIGVHVTGDGSHADIGSIDALVGTLKSRTNGYSNTKYTRFVSAPGAADPGYREGDGHSADIAYRCSSTWQWLWSFTNPIEDARSEWGIGQHPFIIMGTR